MRPRIGFATIGQSPRSDTVPAIVAELGVPVDVVEAGGLDGLSDAEIARLGPQPGEYNFATRLADGRQAVLGKSAAERNLADVLVRLDGEGLDMIVVLCAGARLPALARTLLIEPQRLIDQAAAALSANIRKLGVIVPLEQQVAGFRFEADIGAEVRVTHASPYVGDRFASAGRELADCDLIVMHCMGYTRAMRDKVVAASGVRTLLAPGLLAGILKQLL
jgi:protein AroM